MYIGLMYLTDPGAVQSLQGHIFDPIAKGAGGVAKKRKYIRCKKWLRSWLNVDIVAENGCIVIIPVKAKEYSPDIPLAGIMIL